MKNPTSSLGEKILLFVLMVVLVGLLCLFISVVCTDYPIWTKRYLGLTEKNETLTFLGIGMGGVLLAVQAVIANRRAKAMEKQANAQVDSVEVQVDAVREQAKANQATAKADQATEQGRRQDRLKDAIDHLGHNSDSVRLGSAHELFQLAQDTPDFRVTVLSILCHHIRRMTGEDEYQKKYPSKPSEEVQSLLTLLFVQDHEVFKGIRINLQGCWLNGSNLSQARLEKADLVEAQLHGAHLFEARLHGAELTRAQLHGAELTRAQLHGAELTRAQLHGAELTRAQLHGAELMEAQLHGAHLWGVQLHGADLEGAQLHGVDLRTAQLHGVHLLEAQLHGVFLAGAQLHGADLEGAQLHGASSHWKDSAESFEASINKRIRKESDLSGVIFTGGLTQEAVASIGKGLSDEAANQLREKLVEHIGEPESHELPEKSGAATGVYTAAEAAQWIAEYKKAMSAVSGSG